MDDHPTSQELFEAAAGSAADATDRHIVSCLRCQVLVSRLRDAQTSDDPIAGDPSPATVAALVQHSPTVKVPGSGATDAEVSVGDVWRSAAPVALLLWIHRLVDSDTVEAVPLTLDPSMADNMSLVVGADRSSWECETVLLVDYRSHVHTGALAAKVGTVDAVDEVQQMLAGDGLDPARTGVAIRDSSDQRLDYRDLLRFELSNLAPSIWVETHPTVPPYWSVPRDELSHRLDGVTFTEWAGVPRLLAPGAELVPCVKSAYLGSVVMICRLSDTDFLSETPRLIDACRSLAAEEPDADAIAVFAADEGQDSMVFRRADLRQAIGLPSGEVTDPQPYLAGLGLVDIMFKHFDRYAFELSWSATDQMPEVKQRDLSTLASEQVRNTAQTVATRGRAARQLAKINGYQEATSNLAAVEAFFVRATRGELDDAIQKLVEDTQ